MWVGVQGSPVVGGGAGQGSVGGYRGLGGDEGQEQGRTRRGPHLVLEWGALVGSGGGLQELLGG